MASETLNIVNKHLSYPKVTLIAPSTTGYIHIAAEVDKRFPIFLNSSHKKQLIKDCKTWCEQLKKLPEVTSAVVFDALIIPPGRRGLLKERKDEVHIARFDLCILIETQTPESISTIKMKPAYIKLKEAIMAQASYTYSVEATNARQMGPVDHQKQGVFLFNYFFADNTDQNLAIWEYTAGWFEKETNLHNSTLLLPKQGEPSDYNVINHCRWDNLSDILPSLLFKNSFNTYVLANFHANQVAPIPILYKMA